MDEILWFYGIIGIFLLLGFIYYTTRKLYGLMYGLSGITQVIVVMYTLTRYEWGTGAILLILVAAAAIMMVEGYIITKGRTHSQRVNE